MPVQLIHPGPQPYLQGISNHLKHSQLDDELIEDQIDQLHLIKWLMWLDNLKFNISFLDNQTEMYGTSNALNNDHQLQETYMI